MIFTGLTRRLDELGRVVIPKEIRRTFGIRENDALEICVDEQKGWIILRRHAPSVKRQVKDIQEEIAHWLYDYSPEQREKAKDVEQAFQTILDFLSDDN